MNILQGIGLNDIINYSKFTSNKRDIVLKQIQRIDPEFKAIYTPPQLMYNNCLLDSLNKNIQPIEQPASPVIYSRINYRIKLISLLISEK